MEHGKSREKEINGFSLRKASRTVIEIDLATWNRGCPAEEFVKATWDKSGDRIAVRAYYRDVLDNSIRPCALYEEKHSLKVEGLGAGDFTFFAPNPDENAEEPVELVVHVES